MVESCNDSTQPFAKTICSICYEDLKPIVEDLQAISICGHVFHELCIQQWFEYCSAGRKKCPICKQKCQASNVSRLYFQSVGDSNDPVLSQKLQSLKEDPNKLKSEIMRLEGKVKGLSSVLERQEQELRVCEERLKIEISQKEEALEQTQTINHLLVRKTQELDKSDKERKVLMDKNMVLAEELASIKLDCDFNLREDEIVKYASLGTNPHSKGARIPNRESHGEDIVDRLTKLVVDRNKMYSELLAKHRDEASSHEKVKGQLEAKIFLLEKSKKNIKETETSRRMSTKYSSSVQNEAGPTLNDTSTPQNTIKEPDNHLRKTKRSKRSENVHESNDKEGVGSYILIDDDDAPKVSASPNLPSYDSVLQPSKNDHTDENVAYVYENIQADSCFSPGLLGPHGTKSYLGPWCKNGQSKALNGSTKTSGDLIAVGADGRGGTIKVLKSHNLSSLKSREPAKRGKFGAKASSLQSPKIEHFFSKTSQ